MFQATKIGMMIEVDAKARTVVVASVRKGSEADEMGVKTGQKIQRLDGRDVGVMDFNECLHVAATVRPLLVHFDNDRTEKKIPRDNRLQQNA